MSPDDPAPPAAGDEREPHAGSVITESDSTFVDPLPATVDSGAIPVDSAILDTPAAPMEAGETGDAAVAPANPSRLPSILESLLFAADRPLASAEMAELVEEPDPMVIETALVTMAAERASRGVQLHPVAGGWQFRTHPDNALWVQRMLAQKPVRLSRAQLETLAIVAYRQPVTRPEIDEIRGVDSGGTLKTLLDRQLVRILGKREEPGRPLLYGSTKEFLEFFNLRDLKELPTLREFHELSDEHRAQVEALEQAAPPGSIEGHSIDPTEPPPLQRVDLSDSPIEEDLGHIDELIAEASARAQTATDALGSEGGAAPGGPPGGAGEAHRQDDDDGGAPPPPES